MNKHMMVLIIIILIMTISEVVIRAIYCNDGNPFKSDNDNDDEDDMENNMGAMG